MKPHIKKVNGQWTVTNSEDCSMWDCASASSWCATRNFSDFFHPLNNKFFAQAFKEVVEAEKTNPEEPPLWMLDYGPISEKELTN